jgi:hypothetical protein
MTTSPTQQNDSGASKLPKSASVVNPKVNLVLVSGQPPATKQVKQMNYAGDDEKGMR